MYRKITLISKPETTIDSVEPGCFANNAWHAYSGESVSIFIKTLKGYVLKTAFIRESGKVNVPFFATWCNSSKRPGYYEFKFTMPKEDVIIELIYKKEESNMDLNTPTNKIVDHVSIPSELAMQLSDLLVRQTIRERLLLQSSGDPTKFEEIENTLIPITSKIEAIKVKITRDHIPPHYQFSRYTWNYNGWEVDGDKIQIIDTTPAV